MEAVGDQVSRSVCWCRSSAASAAEGVEAGEPDTYADHEQGAAAPGSEQRWKGKYRREKVMRSPGKCDHEDAEEEESAE